MSLITDRVFYDALKSNDGVRRMVGGRIYSTDIPVPDEQYDNEPLPYIIISYDGMSNQSFVKDYSYEGLTDSDKISVHLSASTREELGELAVAVRRAVVGYFREHPDHPQMPSEYDLTASEVVYWPWRPGYGQALTYLCVTDNDGVSD